MPSCKKEFFVYGFGCTTFMLKNNIDNFTKLLFH